MFGNIINRQGRFKQEFRFRRSQFLVPARLAVQALEATAEQVTSAANRRGL